MSTKIDSQTVLYWLYNTCILPLYDIASGIIKDENIQATKLSKGSITIELKDGRKFKVTASEITDNN